MNRVQKCDFSGFGKEVPKRLLRRARFVLVMRIGGKEEKSRNSDRAMDAGAQFL